MSRPVQHRSPPSASRPVAVPPPEASPPPARQSPTPPMRCAASRESRGESSASRVPGFRAPAQSPPPAVRRIPPTATIGDLEFENPPVPSTRTDAPAPLQKASPALPPLPEPLLPPAIQPATAVSTAPPASALPASAKSKGSLASQKS